MLKWVAFFVAVAAALFIGFKVTVAGRDLPRRALVSAGPDCVGTLELRSGLFPSEVEAVETAWKEPIPTELARIGGVDWWGWVRVCRRDSGWFGEYRDASYRYIGPFEFVTPDGAPAGFDPVGTHYMSSYSWGRGIIVYGIEDVTPPVPYFYLRLAEPELLENARVGN